MNTAALDRPLGFESDEECVHALTAKLLGLKAVHSEVDLIERLEKGLTIATVHSLRLRAHLTDAETRIQVHEFPSPEDWTQVEQRAGVVASK